MKEEIINGVKYKLPSLLTDFQKEMYVHLINWKWKNITREEGTYTKKVKGITHEYKYDAILPESVHTKYPLIYPPILSDLLSHKEKFPFKLHQHFNHMVSSQAANVNLFLPILLNPKVNEIFRDLKSDFKSLASDQLYKGFRIEFWDGNSSDVKGLLCDHSARSGTDSDIAIAYYNNANELCLWLIEHKLTEKEFTECGGYQSDNRNYKIHLCEKSFSDILMNKKLCYYHDVRKFDYWKITEANKSFFINHEKVNSCPFKGGMNQLWRNQLLGFALENEGLYQNVSFSVVNHPGNDALEGSISRYKDLIDNNPKFSSFKSSDIINSAGRSGDKMLNNWIKWYIELYYMKYD
jgi:hypothetical protein